MNKQRTARSDGQAPRRPWVIFLLAFGVPAIALVSITLLQPFSAFHFLGIRGTVWSLFLCAPLTSLCLYACNRILGVAEPEARDPV